MTIIKFLYIEQSVKIKLKWYVLVLKYYIHMYY